jgi:hypothetical protein
VFSAAKLTKYSWVPQQDSVTISTTAAAPTQRLATGSLYKCVRPRAASRTSAGTHRSMYLGEKSGLTGEAASVISGGSTSHKSRRRSAHFSLSESD